MNTRKTAVRRLEAAIPVYDVRRAACSRTPAVELRVRDGVGGWAR